MYQGNLESVLAISAEVDKPVMLYYTADWCAPCKMMERDVFIDSTLIAALNQDYLFYKVDYDSANGKKLNKTYRTNGIPAFFVLDETGKQQYSFTSYQSVPDFFQRLAEAKEPEKSPLFKAQAQYLSGDYDLPFLLSYITLLQQFRQPNIHEVYYKLWDVGAVEELSNEEVIALAERYMISDTTKDYLFVRENSDKLIDLHGEETVKALLKRPIELSLENYAIAGDVKQYTEAAQKLKSSNLGNVDRALYHGEKTLFCATKQYDNLIELVEADSYATAFKKPTDRLLDGVMTVLFTNIEDENLVKQSQVWIGTCMQEGESSQVYAIGGQVEERLGNHDIAMNYYKKSIDLFHQENPDTDIIPTGLRSLMDNLNKKMLSIVN
ncbi:MULTISPECIES: thioredoxin family protein [Sphingobacterium]|uniref:Thioredoxin family protein n=1 Tax=Sphingobacterium populi TaxID=1812824 RepID=A0ABW5UFF0_9SPHI|nr:thioredoxin family protein [Sphingobacterium sp. CFCC 11742]